MKVPVRSSLPLRCWASAPQLLKCSVLPPSASFVSSTATMSAPSQPPRAPAAVNLQALLQPMIADAVQRAFRDLPSPSFAAANAPSSSAAAYIQPSSSSSQAPSSLGESLRFPSFVSTVCLATGTPQSPILPTIALIASNSTLTSPAVANPVSSLSPASFAPGPPASLVPLPPRTSSSRAGRRGFDVGPGRPPIPPKLVDQIRNGEYVEFAELLPTPPGLAPRRGAPGAAPRELASRDSETPAPSRGKGHHVVARLLDRLLPSSTSVFSLPSRRAS